MTIDIQSVALCRSRLRRNTGIEAFIRFPFRLYADDPYWVPPLLSRQRQFLDPAHNPFFAHAEVALWLARRNGEVVGTISSHVDHLHNQVHGRRDGMFGFFECVQDYAVAAALLTTARDWALRRGMTDMRGPLSFSQNHTCGLFVEGDPGPPAVMMPHNPPYYGVFFERFGLVKALDMLAYQLDLAQFGDDSAFVSGPLGRLADRVRRNARAVFRTHDPRTYYQDMEKIRVAYNQAWEHNWGFVPLTDAEFRQLAAELREVIDLDTIIGIEVHGQPAAFAIGLPDINQVLIHMGGRLFPFGWLKWLRRRITQGRVILLGVVKEYRGQGLEALLVVELARVGVRKGYQHVELSWIAEDNHAMQRVIRHVCGPHGVRPYRTYRLYEMTFGTPAAPK
jgi:GNAT superfamily N-acetyltransferase